VANNKMKKKKLQKYFLTNYSSDFSHEVGIFTVPAFSCLAEVLLPKNKDNVRLFGKLGFLIFS
jgi:hypothetical protein